MVKSCQKITPQNGAACARTVIQNYATGYYGLTNEKCANLGIGTDNCQVIQGVLGKGSKGRVIPEEHQQLARSGLPKEFTTGIAGIDGKSALRTRARWLTDHLGQVQTIADLYDVNPNADGLIHTFPKAFKDRCARVQEYVAWELGDIGPAVDVKGAVPYLIAALKSDNPRVRKMAAWALGKIGPDARAAVPHLIAVLEHETLETTGAYATSVHNVLVGGDAWLKDEAKTVRLRKALIWALGRIGPDAGDAVPYLMKALGDNNRDVREFAAWALGRIGPAARSSIKPLESMAKKDPCLPCRATAKEALGKLKGG